MESESVWLRLRLSLSQTQKIYLKKICQTKSLPKNIRKEIPRKKSNVFLSYMFFFHKYVWIRFCLNLNSPEFGFFLKDLKRNFFPKHVWKESTTPKYLNKFSTQESQKKHFPAKGLERGISTQKMSEDILSKTSLTTTCISPKTLWREIRAKQISIEPVSKRYWTKHVYHKLSE